MDNGELLLSAKEADRAALIGEVSAGRLRQRAAAERLGIGVRQVKRLVRRSREGGAAGLVSGHRGRRPNNAIGDGVRREVLELVRERYLDFGPTFAREKLVEDHGHRVSAETLRKWMIEDGLWRAKARREIREHPSRPRRECLGDLVQIDGSPHAWFEGRGSSCTLIVYVDDAIVAAAGWGLLPGGDDRGVHADDARALRGVRPSGGVLLGPLRGVPGEPSGPGGRADAVHAGAADAGHRVDPRRQPAGQGLCCILHLDGTFRGEVAGRASSVRLAALLRDRRHGAGAFVQALVPVVVQVPLEQAPSSPLLDGVVEMPSMAAISVMLNSPRARSRS